MKHLYELGHWIKNYNQFILGIAFILLSVCGYITGEFKVAQLVAFLVIGVVYFVYGLYRRRNADRE